jgi:molecular chaperone GrpE (heat shock protein)
VKRVFEWIKTRLGKPADETVMDLRREAQSLRLELSEREDLIAKLKEDLERQRDGAGARVDESVQAQVEQLLAGAAAPVSQLLTQAHLLEAEGRPVQARDVMAVAKRLVRIFEDNGLELVGSVGETAQFDPNQHEPLGANASPAPGDRVVVRFVGVAYRGKLLRKASVEKAEA